MHRVACCASVVGLVGHVAHQVLFLWSVMYWSERRGSVVVSTSALVTWPVGVRSSDHAPLYIRDCVYLCLSEETLKAVVPFYLVSMPGEVKDPIQGLKLMRNMWWTPHSILEKYNSLNRA